jgi:general secretion pathway protein I
VRVCCLARGRDGGHAALCPPYGCHGGEHGESGFTLVEVIAAFAILALSFSLLMGVVSDGLRRAGDAETEAQAGSLAQSLLARAGTEIALTPELTGRLDNGLSWRLRVEPFAEAGEPSPVAAFQVTAEVFWRVGAQERSLALSTLRLGPRDAR